MAKRFTDTGIYDDPWYIELTAGQKLFWDYLLRKCDNAGVWKVNKPMAEFCIGMRIDLDDMLSAMGKRIHVFDNGSKWFVTGFIDFQYGELKDGVKPHESIKKLLLNHGLDRVSIGYPKGMDTLKDKDKEKDKEKEKDKTGKRKFVPPSLSEVDGYCIEKNYSFNPKDFMSHHGARGWVLSNGRTMVDWKDACRSFEVNREKFGHPDYREVRAKIKAAEDAAAKLAAEAEEEDAF